MLAEDRAREARGESSTTIDMMPDADVDPLDEAKDVVLFDENEQE
jgi:hypothetical protein